MTHKNKCSKIYTTKNKDVIIMNEQNNIAPIKEKLNVVKYETDNIKNLIYTKREISRKFLFSINRK